MDAMTKKELQIIATKIRMAVIEGTFHAKSGHPGGSLSIADLMAYLYWKEMRIDPANPDWAGRDRFVLSKGHAAPALYGALAHRGFFPVSEIASLRKVSSMLQGHPDMKQIPGVDMSSGSLGQGVSCAVCMALAGANIAMFLYRTITAQKLYCSIVSYKRTTVVCLVMFVLVFAACILNNNFMAKLGVSVAGMVVYIIIYRKQLMSAITLAKEIIGGFLNKKKA